GAVLRECLVELARVKEAVTQALPPALDPIGLDAVPQLLRGISAALSMLNRVEAVEVVDVLSHAITDTLNHVAQLPVQQSLDNLADAVIGIEYYLETLAGSRQEPLHLLDAARASLASLAGPPVGGTTPASSSPAALPEAVPAVAPPGPLPAAVAAPAPTPALVLAEGVDAELLAIFIEEAREEIARIGQLFPLWADNEADRESLIRVRRSFHTLKGSGRMVGAQKMGDLAWSIESLLNRVIDGTRTRTAGMLVLLAEAIAALPGIVDELEFGRPFEAALEPVMARAAAYAEGRAEEQPAPIAAPAPALPKGYEPTQLIRVLDVSAMAEPAPAPAVVVAPEPVVEPAAPEPVPEPIVETAAPQATAEPEPIDEAGPQPEPVPVPEPEQELVAFAVLFEEPASLAVPEPAAEPQAVVEPEAVVELAPVPEPEPTPEPVAVEEEEPSEAMAMDISLQDIFRKEVESHLETLRQYLRNAWISPGPHLVSESLYRACHTLRGASRTADSVPSITLAEPLHRWVMRLFDHDFGFDENGLAALADCVARFEDIIEDGDGLRRYERTLAALVARIEELDDGVRRHVADAAAAAAAVAAMPSGDTGIVPVLVQPEPEPAPPVPEPAPEPELVLEPVLPPLESISELVAEAAAAEDFIDLTGLEQFEQAASPVVPGVLVEAAGPTSVDLSLLEYRPEPVVEPSQPEPEQDAEPSAEPAAEAVAEAPVEAPAEEAVEAAPEPEPEPEPEPQPEVEPEAEPEVEPEPTFAAPTFADFLLPGETDVEPALTDALGLNFTGTITLPAALAEEALAAGPELEPEPVAAPVPEPAPAPAAAEAAELAEEPPLDEEFDAEIAAIFCEEATELLEVADGALGALRRDSGSRDRVVELQRALHTLKGGARMAGIRAMGDLSHEVESLLIQAGAGVAALDAETFEAVQASLDELGRMRDLAAEGRASRPASELMARIRRASHLGAMEPVEAPPTAVAPLEPVAVPVPVVVEPIVEVPALAEPAAVAPAPEPPQDAGLAAPTPEAESEPEATAEADAAEAVPAAEPAPASAAVLPGREAPAERAELARVDAELLDAMLNNAGEVSIVRARLEQQLSLIDFNLAELSRVVQRFKEQLRKLEIETEAQVLHRHVDSAPRREDFDPLELDRYSSIQQYSRALAETAADVGSVQNLLETLTREAQNLLTQQGRVVSDLQAGLMRTRMVPFQRHVQRLTRIVRQAAAEAGKRVDLVVQGATGELDRQVLERMLPPFEHMLRNSVVHGLETPAEREAVGKPATGRIDMSVRRDGSEVVIVVADDGAGINLRAVREKAVLRGLLAPKQEISDEEAIHLILESGFSTAVSVTQSAGRGVGMDVVSNEVKKLGGALQIETWEGRGTRFTIRLPFTLAISQALVVRSGDELYALPLPTVEGVVRILKSEVERGLADESPDFEYNGQQYRFQQLGLFVGGEAAVLPEHDTPVPVVLVRAGEHSTAIVTDELLGSREIVVKSVGPMISGIRGISGATILGDGRICIILDIGALVRSEWRARALKPPDATRRDNRVCVLVVDDSITVRRVTQRLLERNDMKVLTAKDGIDAIALLQEQIPDVILLDIEMPRMDGYEVALHIRNDPRLAHIPIVMITSRVGEKHRARAIELGVNEYLGKPYQETQLLEAIEPLVRRRGRQP
ncbi:MAG: Hpt domain-containing protein, partial [Gammaproteobacteria bacterium]|nr:Hpt domain-containing protein [Gammaproteobacteria bacterium]